MSTSTMRTIIGAPHPADQFLDNADFAVALALEPVRCIDCERFVPFGWINRPGVQCHLNVGSSGVVYGHRIPTDLVTHIKDLVLNRSGLLNEARS